MKRTQHTAEQILAKLREAEQMMLDGESIDNACRRVAVSKPTYYRWRREYGGMDTGQIRRLRELEQENSRLRRRVVDLNLEKAILERLSKGKAF